jgi:hypothetical protein
MDFMLYKERVINPKSFTDINLGQVEMQALLSGQIGHVEKTWPISIFIIKIEYICQAS